MIEKQSFLDARAAAAQTVRDETIAPREAVRQHPELAGTYLKVRAAELAARAPPRFAGSAAIRRSGSQRACG